MPADGRWDLTRRLKGYMLDSGLLSAASTLNIENKYGLFNLSSY